MSAREAVAGVVLFGSVLGGPARPAPSPATQPAAAVPAIHGYGAITAGGLTELPGLRHDVCTVTTLDDAGHGSFRACVERRDGPREVRFAVAGNIVLTRASGGIVIREPYLTINGFSAPAPGITITKDVECFNAVKVGATHDVVIVGVRFKGLLKPGDPFPNPQCRDPNNTNTLGVDGDTVPVRASWDPHPNGRPNHGNPEGEPPNPRGVRRLVVAYNTFVNGHDSNPDYWGDIIDVTHQANLVMDSWHPSTISYKQTRPRRFPRLRFSWYANVYARNGERQPQLVNGVYEFDMRDNVIYGWRQRGGGGYGLRFKGFSGDLPTSPVNVVHNAFLAAGSNPDSAGVFGGQAKFEGDRERRLAEMRLFFDGNLFPEGRRFADVNCVTTASAQGGPFPVPDLAQLPPLNHLEVVRRVGMPYRTPEEQGLLDEIAKALGER